MWQGTDAWLLQAIVYAGPRGRLKRVVSQADFINVSVPTRAELADAVGRLEAAGLVKAGDGRVRATRSGRRLVRRSGQWRGGVRSVTPRLEEALARDVPFPQEASAWALSEEDRRQAYEEYTGRCGSG